jgi:hypothetical protein
LAEPFAKEVVGLADDLAKEPPFVGVGYEFLKNDTIDHFPSQWMSSNGEVGVPLARRLKVGCQAASS